jgi:fibronectin-binding autotransporter adhesin
VVTRSRITRQIAAAALGTAMALACLHLVGQGSAPARAAPSAAIHVNTTADEWDSGSDCSLREAIEAADADAAFGGCTAGSGDDTIVLPAGTYTLTRAGAGENFNSTGDLDVRATDGLTITGAGPGLTVIDAASLDRVLDLRMLTGTVSISALTIMGGDADDDGGGIASYHADLTLIDTIVTSNTTTGSGGGLYVYDGSATLSGCQLFSNNASSGGGVFASFASVTMNGGQVISNTSTSGGGLQLGLGGGTLDGTSIRFNRASSGGGAICFGQSSVTLSGVEVFSNTAVSSGGGIMAHSGSTVTLSGGRIVSNTAEFGGGLYLANGSQATSDGDIMSNTATIGRGGGVCLMSGAALTLTAGSVVAGNDGPSGGGVSIYSGTLALNGGQIISNTADDGGGLYLLEGSVWSTGGQVISNTAENGGGLYNAGGTFTLVNTTVSKNRATSGAGGGLYNASGTTVITFTTIAGNSSAIGGGGIQASAGSVLVHNTILAYNTPANCGGTLISNDYNLENAGSCGFGGDNDLPSTNPQLASLAYIDGTWIHRLAKTSPAIDAGLCVSGITTDQRGVMRFEPCDIGSYEYAYRIYLPLVLRSY